MDREKVIKGLEACTGEKNDCAGHTCPYWDYDEDAGCRIRMELDALAMLKEKDTVKPKKTKGYNPPMYTLYEYECEKCNSVMMNKQPFCMGCGRRVIWDA